MTIIQSSPKGAFVYRHFLIAFDGSELSNKAVEQGIALAKTLSAHSIPAAITSVSSTVRTTLS